MKTFTLTLFLAVSMFSLSGQIIGNRILDRATQKVNDRLNQRANQEVDKQVDHALDSAMKSDSPNAQNDPAKTGRTSSQDSTMSAAANRARMFGSVFGEAKTLPAYTFKYEVTIHTTVTKENGKVSDESDMGMLFPVTSEYQGMLPVEPEGEKDESDSVSTWSLFDFTNKSMITFTESEGKKEAMAIPFQGFTNYLATKMEEADSVHATQPATSNTSFRKTGKTKVLLGYTCEEFEAISQDGKMNYWFTDDVNFSSFGFVNMMAQQGTNMSGPIPNGYMMELISVDNKSKETTHMLVTKVTKIDKTVKMSDYTIMSLGGAVRSNE